MDRIPTPWIAWLLAATLTAAAPVPRLIGIGPAGSVSCEPAGASACCAAPVAAQPCEAKSCPATPGALTREGEEGAAGTPPPGCEVCLLCQCGMSVLASFATLVPPEPEPSLRDAPPVVPASLEFEPTAPPPKILPDVSC